MIGWLLLILAVLGVISLLLPRLITSVYAWPRTHSIDEASPKSVAIVFGAGLWRDGSPTPVLRDRVATAAKLYTSGKVDKLLLSGDNSTEYYNEPAAMQEYAINLGIPEEDIVLDYAGRRTYDTCYRAQVIFGVQEAILITQKFHLPRSIYTCNKLGIPSEGVPADLRDYRRGSLLFWNLRELPATLVALWELYVTQPTPILGEPEPIFPEES
jgi:vancomycin permeability regulator SanA